MRIALVNTNRIKPPIGPLGLEYVAEALCATGHRPQILDLCWEEDWKTSIIQFFAKGDFGIAGFTLRNTDDCAFTSRQSFIGEFVEIITTARKYSESLFILGGVGFSTMPVPILEECNADAGIYGDGEYALVRLADRIEKGQNWHDLNNLIWWGEGKWHRNRALMTSALDLPPMSREMVDNRRYFREGGQAGFESKRGCSGKCIYCCEPIAKGRRIRFRRVHSVVTELEKLLSQGIDYLHTCDSEFNIPEWHAVQICEEIVNRSIGNKLRWYAYCAPVPFSRELARLMHAAGCVGINFGIDSGDEMMLKRLKRNFTRDDILQAVRFCKEQGITVMLDLLLGSPGENRSSITKTIELVKRSGALRIGMSIGVRVYPGTELSGLVADEKLKEGLSGGGNLAKPLFFMDPMIGDTIFDILDSLIEDDERFFFFDPTNPERNYNYASNERLVNAIRQGYRGAYWDILRRLSNS